MFQNRRGLYSEGNLSLEIKGANFLSWKEIYVSNLQKVFTETRLEDVDLTKTQPCKHFVYMERGNPSHSGVKREQRAQTATYRDTFLVQLFDTRNSSLANAKIYVLLYSFCFDLF